MFRNIPFVQSDAENIIHVREREGTWHYPHKAPKCVEFRNELSLGAIVRCCVNNLSFLSWGVSIFVYLLLRLKRLSDKIFKALFIDCLISR
jgi:hypothetical protein